MTLETLRPFLYPLGLVATLFFTARMLLQWMQSERKKTSVVTPTFWILSLFGNALLMIHSFLQLQFPVCLIQVANGTISWRNLNLMGKRPRTFRFTLALLVTTLALVTFLFLSQKHVAWMRSPLSASAPSPLWHLVGLIGILLFASRFWIQWWLAEKKKESFLGRSFWWSSLIGASLSLLYFIRLADPINVLSYGFGLLPYARNLMLLRTKTKAPPTSLFFIAGEQSGDVLGGHLIDALKQRAPTLQLAGVGGPQMRACGMRCPVPMESLQTMGATEVVRALPKLIGRFQAIKNEILAANPKAVVMIDYPDFNMLLAKALRKRGYQGKLIHYVCPSIWAWRKKRVKPLAERLDHLLSILPFETRCFKSTSLPVTYVGHPLVTVIAHHTYDSSWNPEGKRFLSIFPGSRPSEIAHNLPLQLAAAARFSLPLAISVSRPDLEPQIRQLAPDALLVPGHLRYELMRDSALALATCGTVILELGLHQTPTVVTYRVSPFNYFIGRYIVRLILPSYNLVNVICGHFVYPEFVHHHFDIEEIVQAMQKLLDHPEPCRRACAELKILLQDTDASRRAADTILAEVS